MKCTLLCVRVDCHFFVAAKSDQIKLIKLLVAGRRAAHIALLNSFRNKTPRTPSHSRKDWISALTRHPLIQQSPLCDSLAQATSTRSRFRGSHTITHTHNTFEWGAGATARVCHSCVRSASCANIRRSLAAARCYQIIVRFYNTHTHARRSQAIHAKCNKSCARVLRGALHATIVCVCVVLCMKYVCINILQHTRTQTQTFSRLN